jgi:hypothetical protein
MERGEIRLPPSGVAGLLDDLEDADDALSWEDAVWAYATYRAFYETPRQFEFLTPDSIINFDDDNQSRKGERSHMSQLSERLPQILSVLQALGLGPAALLGVDSRFGSVGSGSAGKADFCSSTFTNTTPPAITVPPPPHLPTAILTAETIFGPGKGKQKLKAVLDLLVPFIAPRIGISIELARTLAAVLINIVVGAMNADGMLPKPAPDNTNAGHVDDIYLPAQSFEGQIPPDADILAKGPYVAGRDYVYVATAGVAWGIGQANQLPIDGFKPHHKLQAE